MHRLIQKISNSFWVVSIKQYYDKIKCILQYIKNMNKITATKSQQENTRKQKQNQNRY